jgi:translocation and assembly module TamA
MHHARYIFITLLFATGTAFAQSNGVIAVNLDGIDGDAEANARAALSMVRYAELAELNEAMVRRMHRRAPEEIRQALVPFGHYETTVTGTLEAVPGGWRAHYSVDPGPRVRIRDVDVRVDGPGRNHPEIEPGELPQPGQPLFHPDYERIKQRLRTASYGLGYLDARFATSELRVSVSERAADIVVHLETGERYRFGPVTLEQDILDEDFLRRYLQFSSGDPFNNGDLLALQYALSTASTSAWSRLKRNTARPLTARYRLPYACNPPRAIGTAPASATVPIPVHGSRSAGTTAVSMRAATGCGPRRHCPRYCSRSPHAT